MYFYKIQGPVGGRLRLRLDDFWACTATGTIDRARGSWSDWQGCEAPTVALGFGTHLLWRKVEGMRMRRCSSG